MRELQSLKGYGLVLVDHICREGSEGLSYQRYSGLKLGVGSWGTGSQR